MLTPEEHLRLYATFAGVAPHIQETLVKQRLSEVGLAHKAADKTFNLSGGQRRKLSLAVAFVGVPDVCIVDEPSSGMDVAARRLAWDILRKQKRTTTILLTTHYLDEAEALSDRIAIMSSGRLAACGSNLFLKRNFGSGYHLFITLQSNMDTEKACNALLGVVRGEIPSAEIAMHSGKKLTLSLPLDCTSLFPALVNTLENESSSLGISAYGLSSSTLQDVFLNIVGKESDGTSSSSGNSTATSTESLEANQSNSTATLSPKKDKTSDTTSPLHGEHGQTGPASSLQGYGLLVQQFFCLVRKRSNIFRRDWASLVFQLVLPTLFLILALGIGELNRGSKQEFEPREVSRAMMIPGKEAIWASANGTTDAIQVVSSHHPAVNNVKNAENVSSLSPCACFCPTMDQVLQENVFNIRRGCSERFDDVPEKCTSIKGLSININDGCQAEEDFLETLDLEILQRQEALTGCENEERGACEAFFLNSTGELENTSVIVDGSATYVEIYSQPRVVLPNPTAYWPVPVQIAELNGMALSHVTGGQRERFVPELYPLPRLPGEVNGDNDISIPLLVAIFVALGAAVLSASYSIHLAWERASNAKHLQMVSGVNVNIYWLANLVFDLCTYVIPFALFMFVFIVFDSRLFSSATTLAAVAVLLALFGWAVIPAVYALHFFFSTEMNAFVGQLAAFGFFSFGFLLSGAILENLQNEDEAAKATWDVLQWIWKLLPHFCLGKGLFDIALNTLRGSTIVVVAGQPQVLGAEDPFKPEIAGIHMGFLGMEGCIFFAITLIVEHWPSIRHSQAVSKMFPQKGEIDLPEPIGEDDRVRDERYRIQDEVDAWNHLTKTEAKSTSDVERSNAKDASFNDLLLLKDLKLVYPNKNAAVRNVSLGVQRSENFGLVGINGAGKTSTFKMITAECTPSSGEAFVRSRSGRSIISVTKEAENARKHMGYCPQVCKCELHRTKAAILLGFTMHV